MNSACHEGHDWMRGGPAPCDGAGDRSEADLSERSGPGRFPWAPGGSLEGRGLGCLRMVSHAEPFSPARPHGGSSPFPEHAAASHRVRGSVHGRLRASLPEPLQVDRLRGGAVFPGAGSLPSPQSRSGRGCPGPEGAGPIPVFGAFGDHWAGPPGLVGDGRGTGSFWRETGAGGGGDGRGSRERARSAVDRIVLGNRYRNRLYCKAIAK